MAGWLNVVCSMFRNLLESIKVQIEQQMNNNVTFAPFVGWLAGESVCCCLALLGFNLNMRRRQLQPTTAALATTNNGQQQ